jgi:hypothetical protein
MRVTQSTDQNVGGSSPSERAQPISDRHADERLADEFHQRYRDARTALRHKAHADS